MSAATDMKFNVVHDHSAEFTALGQKLPIGRIYGSGKSFIPNIRRDLYDKLKAARDRPNEPIKDGVYLNIAAGNGSSTPAADLPETASPPATPRTWADVRVGDLIIAQSSHIEGWWEAVVVERGANDVLTLRWRDYPAEGTVQRHLGGVALINPGPE